MEKGVRKNFRGFRKALAYISVFAMMLGLIEPVFVMKVQAAMSYPVTVNIFEADQKTPNTDPGITGNQYNYTYHVVVSLKDSSGEVVGWGFANISDINKATQTVEVTKFWTMDTVTVGDPSWQIKRNAWKAFNNGNDFSLANYKVSVRIYYGLKPDFIDSWNSGLSYEDIVKQQDTIDGYKFLSKTRHDEPIETKADANKAVINLAKDNGTSYKVRLKFEPSAYAFTDDDNVYVLTTVKHKSGNYTYHYEKLNTNASQKTQDIAVTQWMDGNGNVQPSEKYSSSEESVSVKLIKVSSGTTPNMNMLLSHTNCYDVAEGGDVGGYTVSYEGISSQFITAAGADQYTTTDYDVIKLTKIQPTPDYTFLSVLGNSVNYGVVSDRVSQTGHSETNMATKSYEANGNNLDPDLAGDGDTQVPGTFLVGEITGSNLRLGGNTPATAIVVTSDTNKVTDDGSNKSVKVEMEKDKINEIVDQMISDMQDVSQEMLTHEATIHPQIVNGKMELDTTNFPDGVTIYIDADDYLDAIKTDSSIRIKKNPNQLIVFNFKDSTKSENVTIGKIQLDSGSGYKNTNTETGQFGSEQNTAADLVAQQVVWNMASVKTATTNIAGGIFLMPRTDSTLNLGGTSCGWGISAGLTKLGEGGEFHFVYRGLKQDQTVELAARKLVNNKYPTDDQIFEFGIEKYNNGTFETVMVTDPDTGLLVDYVLTNDGNTVKIPVTQMTIGENIYRIYEIGKADGTSGAYEYDDTSFYAKFTVKEVEVGATPVKVASSVAYYKTFTEGVLSGQVGKSNVVFKNTSKPNSFTLKKEVTGDADSSNPDFTMQLKILDSNDKQAVDAVTTGAFEVQGISGKTTLSFTDGVSEPFTMKKGGMVVVTFPDGFEENWQVEVSETALPANYTLTTSYSDRRDTYAGGVVTLVNNYTAPRGGLEIAKNVTGNTTDARYDKEKKYTVKVAFDTAGTYKVQLPGEITSNPKAFQAGTEYSYPMEAGQKLVITDVPEGVKYTVTEEELSDADKDAGYAFVSVVDNGTGSIVKDIQTKVDVNNKYTVPTGSLTVKKEVTGDTGNVNYDPSSYAFTVNVTFDEAGTYTVKKNGTASDDFTGTSKSFELKADDTIEISNIPVGVGYVVTESALSSTLTDAGYAIGSITNNGEGKITKGDTELVVNNTYVTARGELDITKKMTGEGYVHGKKYKINVKFDTAGEYKVTVGTAAEKVVEFAANTEETFEIQENQVIRITDVPVGAVYTVTETESSSDKAAGYALTGITNGTGSVAKTKTDVTVNNTFTVPSTGSLKVTKSVTGDTAYPKFDADKEYTVNIKLSQGGTYKVTLADGTTSMDTFIADEFRSYTIYDGKSVEISNLPLNTKYTVTEDDLDPVADVGYEKVSISGDGTGEIKTNGQLAEVTVNNKYTTPKGKLTVQKNVSITGTSIGFNSDKTYAVEVQFDKDGTYAVKENDSTKNVEFKAGVAQTYKLKAGATVEFDNVPEGVKYTVTEPDLDAEDNAQGYYNGTIIDGVGLISATQESLAKVNNTYTAPKGSLKVTKNVTGDTTSEDFDASRSYKINVSFGTTGTYDVTISGGSTEAVYFKESEARAYQLKKDQYVTFANIPLGTSYAVGEVLSAQDQALGYTNTGITNNGVGTLKSTLAEVTVENHYKAPVKGGVTVTKQVSGDTSDPNYDANKTYDVNISFDKAGTYRVSYNGLNRAIGFAENVAQTFALKNGASFTVDKIPEGVKYTVTESALSAEDLDLGYKTGSISNANGTISADQTEVTVNNSFTAPATGALIITKKMTGDTESLNYDATKSYEINVTFDRTGVYDVEQGGTTKQFAFTAGTAQPFALKGGETIEISKVIVGTGYSLTESDLSDPDLDAGYSKGVITNEQGTISTTPVNATVNNHYKRQTASLTLTKTVVNNDGAVLPDAYKLAVRDEDNNYAQDTAGTFAETEHYFDVLAGDAGAVVIENLEIGQIYVIEEDEVKARVSGYDLDVTGDISVKIKMIAGGKTANVINTYQKKDTGSPRFSVAISKRAEGSTEELKGATLQIDSADGGDYMISWVTSGAIKALQLPVGKYTLTETDAPNGYLIADPIPFEVTSDGKVIVGDEAAENNVVAMVDKQKEFAVNISKKAVGGGDELAGAKLTVESTDGKGYSQTWNSDGSLKTLQLEMGKYKLTEIQAPNNYELAESIEFEVTSDGKVVVNGKYVTENTILMVDGIRKKEISISKVDALNSEEIAGANLVLYKIKSDGSLDELTSWISSATEVFKFTLEAGNYAIKETVAPDGYELVESLVKFNLSFDVNGNPITAVTEGPGVYNATEDKISFKDDPIKVTGGLVIQVVDEVTGEPVPSAVVEVTEPGGETKEYTTDTNGQITKYVFKADLGDYSIKVTSVPDGYTVTVNKEQNATVVADKITEAIAKTNTASGALTIQVLDKVSGTPVPDAVVEVTQPDDIVRTFTTDDNGRVNEYMEKDGKGHYVSDPGAYKIKVISVPDGYSVDTGEIATVMVTIGNVTEHIARIVTKDGTTPEASETPKEDENNNSENSNNSENGNNSNDDEDDDDEDDDDDDTTENVTVTSIGLQEETVSGTTKKSLAGGTRKTETVTSLKTGEAHTSTYLFGSSMAALFMGAVAYVLSKRKRAK